MKMKSMVLFAVAIALGLFAMLGVQEVMSQNQTESEYVQVLVAVTDIGPGIPLDETNVAFKKWPLEAVPEGAVTKEEQYVERALKGATVAGEVIMQAKLGEKGVFGASSEIPDGMRAVTVSVDSTKTHSGQIQPGDRVDVLVTYKTRTQKGMITRTKAVLEFIKVFSVDDRRASVAGESQESIAKNISLLVTPDQANLLMLAQNKGMLHLALRHKTDSEPAKAATVDDTFFDEVDTQVGEADAMEDEGFGSEESSETAQAPSPESITEALEKELSGQGTPSVDPSASAPAQPTPVETQPETWKIQIFAGEELRIEEVQLPEENEESEEEPAKVSDLWKTIQGVVSKKSK
jgi:pilus assembly protein CpaB